MATTSAIELADPPEPDWLDPVAEVRQAVRILHGGTSTAKIRANLCADSPDLAVWLRVRHSYAEIEDLLDLNGIEEGDEREILRHALGDPSFDHAWHVERLIYAVRAYRQRHRGGLVELRFAAWLAIAAFLADERLTAEISWHADAERSPPRSLTDQLVAALVLAPHAPSLN